MEPSVDNVVDWCFTHGIVMKMKKTAEGTLGGIMHAPVSLLPYDFDGPSFNAAVLLSPIFSKLIDDISTDHDWLFRTLSLVSVALITSLLFHALTCIP